MQSLFRLIIPGFLGVFFLAAGTQAATDETPPDSKLKTAALHPVLGDLARRIGGEHVEVVDLLKPNGNLHAFEPSTDDIVQAGKSSLVFASGKKIEPYLPKLKDALPKDTLVIDVGESIPDVMVSAENAGAACCEGHDGHDHSHDHGHDHGSVDPHWWHSMDNIKRAAVSIEKALARKLPEHAQAFTANREQVTKQCDRLRAWSKRQIMSIPQEDRLLVTGHAAFGHLCKELGLRQIAVQGASREDEGAARRLAETLKLLRELKPGAVFPEYQSSPKVLEEIAKSLSIKTAKPLVSDGTAPEAHTFDKMYEYNINAIVEALAPGKS